MKKNFMSCGKKEQLIKETHASTSKRKNNIYIYTF